MPQTKSLLPLVLLLLFAQAAAAALLPPSTQPTIGHHTPPHIGRRHIAVVDAATACVVTSDTVVHARYTIFRK